MVDTGVKLVIVEGPNKALFDMVVTPKTQIKFGNQELNIKDLSRYQNKPVWIKFVPERRGDVASLSVSTDSLLLQAEHQEMMPLRTA